VDQRVDVTYLHHMAKPILVVISSNGWLLLVTPTTVIQSERDRSSVVVI